MSTMAENVIAAGADNRPPMLERSQYDSWQSRMLLCIRGKEHKKHLLDSVQNGPFQFGTIDIPATPTTPASTRGLPLGVYTLVNHHIVVKEIWDIFEFLIEGSELSLQERESKLYV
ncbi:hypothetical protein Tco_1493640 [Tanacetum coccineum]